MLGGAGHSALKGGEVGGDAIDVKVNEGLLAFGAEEEGAVGGAQVITSKRLSKVAPKSMLIISCLTFLLVKTALDNISLLPQTL